MASSSAIPFAAGQEIFPEGVVFDPADEQLVLYYLMGKVYGFTDGKGFRFIKEIEFYDSEPSALFDLPPDSGHDKKYFLTVSRKKSENGTNVNRQTPGGIWRKTGPPSYVNGIDGQPVATKTSLVYHKKKQMTSKPVTSQWLMKEYMLLESELPNQEFTPWTLCVVYQSKSDHESYKRSINRCQESLSLTLSHAFDSELLLKEAY